MLLSLKVKDFGIIEEIDWHPQAGFNVITGETGAGKSLVIEAIESLLTGRLDEDVIRTGAPEARIEGVFALPANPGTRQVKAVLTEKGVAADEDSVIITCELRKQGRSVIRINGSAVPRTILQHLTHCLVDIHGQSEHLSLLNRRYHLDFLDGYGGTLEKRQRFSDMVSRLGEAERELKSLIEAEKDFARKQEFLRFHLDEIKKARLRVGEQEELESERTRLAFSEKLKSLSSEVYGTMSGEESSRDSGSATGRLRESLGLMRKLVDIDPSLKPHLDYLSDASYGLEEVARAVRAYSESLEFDPRRLEEVESRLELLRNLERKYGPTVEQVLEYLQKSQVELDTLVHSSERRVELENGISRLRGEMAEIAAILSTARSKAAVRLAKEVKKELDDLQMSDVEFEVAVTQEESPGGLKLSDGRTCTFSAEGVDIVEFMVSTNPGEPLKPLVKIASTGEMSRFMLALKGALSRSDNTPVLIFDEIDIGVGGRSGEIVGRKLWLLARGRQVLCVTHLPQIAAFADAHCRIEKASEDSRTTSRLEVLENKERIEELAAMLSGARLTEASLKNAKDIAQKATKFKKAFTSGNTA